MTTETIVTKHYNGKYEIAFYPKSHRRKLVGTKEWMDGVSSATGIIDKSRALMYWADGIVREFLMAALEAGEPLSEPLIEDALQQRHLALDEAATSGTLVHEWIEQYVKGEDPEVPEDKAVRNGVLAFLKWVRKYDVRFVASEQFVLSEKYWYHGIMDAIFTMKPTKHKVNHALDYKTGSGIYMEQVFQLSGYQHAHAEEFGTKFGSKFIARLIKKDKYDKKTGELLQAAGDFEFKEFPAEEHESHFKGFLNCLEIKRMQKQWDKTHGAKPKKAKLKKK